MDGLRLLVPIVLLSISGCALPSGWRVVWPDDAIVYQPTGPYAAAWSPPPGFVHEDVWFESADGTKLHGWFCPVENPRAIVLFAHGNAGNLADRWPLLQAWTEQLGVSVMILDYRGYGQSEGVPSENGVLADARAARTWLAARTDTREQDIVLYGRSLGGGVMVELAASDGTRALILESTFTSLPDVANDAFPLMPVGLLMKNRFRSIDKIGHYHGPLWIAHGNADNVIPFSHGKRLFEAANEPKRFVPIGGADHNWAPTRPYLRALDQFLAGLAKQEDVLND